MKSVIDISFVSVDRSRIQYYHSTPSMIYLYSRCFYFKRYEWKKKPDALTQI